MDAPSRLEKMVGEILGLRMLVAELVAAEGARSPDAAAHLEKIRTSAQATMAGWPIGSDTPEGAERIRHCAQCMLTEFPGPTIVT